MRRVWIVVAVVAGLCAFMLLIRSATKPTAEQVYRECISASLLESVKDLKVQQSRGKGLFALSETFLCFTIESNAFHRIVREKNLTERYGQVFSSQRLGAPPWFDGIRTQNFGYMRVITNRWFFVGPRKFEAELLARDESGSVYYYSARTR